MSTDLGFYESAALSAARLRLVFVRSFHLSR
jgi:hypothetical protein